MFEVRACGQLESRLLDPGPTLGPGPIGALVSDIDGQMAHAPSHPLILGLGKQTNKQLDSDASVLDHARGTLVAYCDLLMVLMRYGRGSERRSHQLWTFQIMGPCLCSELHAAWLYGCMLQKRNGRQGFLLSQPKSVQMYAGRTMTSVPNESYPRLYPLIALSPF